MKKKVLCAWVLALGMLCSVALPAQASELDYSDVKGHYAQNDIETWSAYGVLQGYPDGTFRPDGSITRAELAAVLDRIMGYQETAENSYPDVPAKKWYTESILHVAAQEIYTGDKGGKMNPNAAITRQEAFVALGRAFWLEESEGAPGFADDAAVAGWARGYIAAMKEAGYISGDNKGNIRPAASITRAEVVTVLNKMVAALVRADGTYSQNCGGNLVINAHDVTLKNMVIEGDLIVADGVAEGDVYLDGVTVKGDIILRGCGENSFHILPGCQVKNIIITKTTEGRIRLVNESGETIPMIFVNDGKGGVTLDGGNLGDVVVACDVPVTITASKVGTLSVVGDAQVTVEKGTTVAQVEMGETAQGAQLTVNGKVTALVNDAGAAVTNNGTIGGGSGSASGGSSSGGSSSSGSSSSGGGSGSVSTPKVISEVSLQLLAPQFAESPDMADVLGVGYTARTAWSNADGTPASYRWKTSSGTADTFTANQAYQAVITLTPVSGYSFAEDLRVKVTDGKDTPTSYTPAQVTVSGGNRVVTMVYDKTEDRDPVSTANVAAPAAVDLGGTALLRAAWWDNCLVDPATYTYQWYRCSDGNGGGKTLIPGATGKEYTIPVSDTQSEGNLYYCFDMVAMGKVYSSSIREIEVHDALDLSTIPVPVVEGLFVTEDGRWARIEIGDLMCHKDISYMVMVNAEIIKTDGTWLGGSVSMDVFDYYRISDDGRLEYELDLADCVSKYIFAMLNAGLSYDVEVGAIQVMVTPQYKGSAVADKEQSAVFNMMGKGAFHVFTTEDGNWQGPPKSLQLVIRSSGGTFVDRNAPESNPVPNGRYQQVKAIFRKGADWVDAEMEGYWEPYWYGTLRIPNSWLDGFTSGTSMAEAACLFYAGNPSSGGMDVYAMKLMTPNIIFQSGNE